MEPIRCLIIDDEPLARQGLREYIGDTGFLRLEGECDEPLKAASLLRSGNIQLIFLDIELPKVTGLDFFRSLDHPPPVVFTTAYPQFAPEGFDLNAVDYLVKPFSFERFLKAALRVREYYELRQANESSVEAGPAQDYFFIRSDNRLVKIFFGEVLFVEALQNYVAIHTTTKKYLAYLTFKSIEDYLPTDRFIKTHKSFIISAAHIDAIEGGGIRIGPHVIPISRGSREAVMEKLLRGRLPKR